MNTQNRTAGWIPLSSYDDTDTTGMYCRILGRYATSDPETYGTIVADFGSHIEVEIEGQHHLIDAGKMVSVWG